MSRILFLGAPISPHAERWIRFLIERGHDVRIGTIYDVPEWAESISTRLRTRGDVSRPGSIADLREALPKLRSLVARVRPEATLAYYATSYGLMAALTRVPNVTVATAGGDVLVDPYDTLTRRFRNRLILSLSLRHATTVLAWSGHVSERLRALGVPERKIFEQVRGVDIERFCRRESAEDRETHPGDAPRILSNRLFKPLYDLPTLLRALGRLRDQRVAFEATLLGEGAERPALEALTRELGLQGAVEMPGLVGEEAMIAALARADVYVSTSTTDGASASLFEALSMGVYPVVTDIPANRPWIEEGANGRLFPPGDDELLARALTGALADPEASVRATDHNVRLAREKLDLRRNLERIEARMLQGAE